jgi:hypothetical protein
MKSILRVGFCWLSLTTLSLAAPNTTPTDSNSPEFQKAMNLIRQLRDDRFATREMAARKLVAMGRDAKAALLVGKEDSDPDVADRCRRILPQAIAADLQARIDAFLKDKEGKQKHDLPVWTEYQTLVGKDNDSRLLFVEMLKSNHELFEQFEMDSKRFPDKYAARCNEMIQFIFTGGGRNQGPNLGDMATMFFFGSYPENAKATANNQYLGNVLWQPVFQNTIRATGKGVPFKKLFFTWMDNRTDVNSQSQCLSIIQQFNLKEGIGFAAKMMKDKNNQMYMRAQALTVVGKMGGKDHIPDMEALLDDDTQVQQFNLNNIQGTVEIRDIALAMAIHLKGQKPKEFGFELLQNEQQLWQYYFLGFETADKRKASQKKWKDWLEAEKKKNK